MNAAQTTKQRSIPDVVSGSGRQGTGMLIFKMFTSSIMMEISNN